MEFSNCPNNHPWKAEPKRRFPIGSPKGEQVSLEADYGWKQTYKIQALASLISQVSWGEYTHQAQERMRAAAFHEIAQLQVLDYEFSPTDYATARAKDVINALYVGSVLFPLPSIVPDGDGGILLDWQQGTRLVRLVIPDSTEQAGYLYHEDGPRYAAEYDLSTGKIKTWLTWLVRNEQAARG